MPGFFISVIMIGVLFFYAGNNLKTLFLRLNPNVGHNVQLGYYDLTNIVDLSTTGF